MWGSEWPPELYYRMMKKQREAGGGGGESFSPGSIDGLFAWDDPSDLTTLFQDSAMTTPVTAEDDPVRAMLDKSGNGHHLTGAAPLYKISGGLHWLQSDASASDTLANDAITLEPPFTRVSAWRLLAANGGQIDGLIESENSRLGFNFFLTSFECGIVGGGDHITALSLPSVGVDFVVTEIYNGASSALAIDNGGYATGSITATSTARLRLFELGGGNFSNARFSGIVIVARVLTDPEIALLRTYLAAKQGRVL